MFYVKNVPVWERVLRVVIGAILVAYALLAVSGAVTWVLIASAAGLVMSGMFGFCPACAMVGRRLKK
jgi:hypothetical protein